MRPSVRLLITVSLGLAAYLCFWPVAVRPVAWDAPQDTGYVGDFSPNDRLSDLRFVTLAGRVGPEDAAVGPEGMVYVATHDGEILRLPLDGSPQVFANTGGRPLGIEFANDGTLFVADAYRGLLSVDRDGQVTLRANQTSDGSPILYADDLDIGPDGAVYFSDASTRFGANDWGGTLAASVLDLVEHSANGRVLRFDPKTGATTVFADGLTFANGVALDRAGDALLVVETGGYRVWRFPLAGGPGQVILDNLPGFPDNINPAQNGTFWVGLVSPRNAIMDKLSGRPFLRRMVMRLPDVLRPAPTRYGFVFRMDANGQVLETLQDPSGDFALSTGAITLPEGQIVVTSLTEDRIGILDDP